MRDRPPLPCDPGEDEATRLASPLSKPALLPVSTFQIGILGGNGSGSWFAMVENGKSKPFVSFQAPVGYLLNSNDVIKHDLKNVFSSKSLISSSHDSTILSCTCRRRWNIPQAHSLP